MIDHMHVFHFLIAVYSCCFSAPHIAAVVFIIYLSYGGNNNNNVHLSCAHQCPERSHDTY